MSCWIVVCRQPLSDGRPHLATCAVGAVATRAPGGKDLPPAVATLRRGRRRQTKKDKTQYEETHGW